MAIQKLTDISTDIETARLLTVATSFSTYKFGYLGEINQMHNTNYPLILLMPPTTRQPNMYKNDEVYNLRFYCYRFLIDTGQTITGPLLPPNYALEMTFDDLQDRFLVLWQQFALSNENKYIIDGAFDVERVSHEFNDELVGIEVSVQLRAYRNCLQYIDDVSGGGGGGSGGGGDDGGGGSGGDDGRP